MRRAVRPIHPTRVGIGLHVGEAVPANVGSTDRKEYPIIGSIIYPSMPGKRGAKYRAHGLA
jgi:class 3 adenylate cyclase